LPWSFWVQAKMIEQFRERARNRGKVTPLTPAHLCFIGFIFG
jgi:hypothetical protein